MSDWLNEQAWVKNDRIIETFISGGGKDLHGDIVDIEKMKDVMPWLVENGFYEWQHEGFPIGKFLGWKEENGKIMVKVGIYDSKDSKFPQHDQIWEVIKNWHKKYGNHGQSSIKGLPVKERIIRYGGRIANKLDLIPMWAVGWVGNNAANKDAVVTRINTAAKSYSIEYRIAMITKSLMTVAKQVTTMIENQNEVNRMEKDKTKEEAPATPATEEAPAEAPPADEGVMAEIEKLETAVTRMGQALSSIDQGTPEVAGEIAAAAEDAMAIVAAGTDEEMKKKATASEMTEIKKRLSGLQKSVSDLAGMMEVITKKLSRPVQKSKAVAIQPKQKGIMPQTADESYELFTKIRNNR